MDDSVRTQTKWIHIQKYSIRSEWSGMAGKEKGAC